MKQCVVDALRRVSLLVASAIVLPTSEASARCWNNGWGWPYGPGLLTLPFVAAGAIIAGAAVVATAPVRAIVGPRYYAPPPAYSGHDALLFCQKIGPSNSAAP